MELFLFYLLRVTIAATILYLFFKFILSKRTFHAINRIVVLSIVVMTLVLPLFTVTLPQINFFQPKVEAATTQLTVEQVLALLKAGGYTNTSTVDSTPAEEIPWIKILGIIYLIGLTLALVRFTISFIRMSRIIRRTKKVRLDDNSLLCISDKKVSPFSWMKFIVLSKDDFTDESKDIIRHEQAHVAFGHSYDLLFLDVYSLVFWFNPFAWLLRLELQTIHEYQADEKVLAEGANAKNYHLSLIRQCVGEYKFALANNFEYNNLHKRIKMTMKTKSSSRQKWLYGTIGLSVMLCIVVLSFNGLKATASNLKEMIKSEILPAADSIEKTTPSVVKIRKVDVKNNATIASPIIIDTVAPDTKIKVLTSPNEDIRVVGYGTLNGAKPLTIVNGKESTNGMSSINENDISSIQVLKDASATKLYGEKGKDGVILITTKEYTASHENEMIIRKAETKSTDSDDKKLTNKNLEVLVAGYGTLNGAKPLIIVNGKESYQGMNSVDIQDVSSISVLKDASSTAVYGNKGKNGVILITTKEYAASHKNEEIHLDGYETIKGVLKNAEKEIKAPPSSIFDQVGGPKPLMIIDGEESTKAIDQNKIENIQILKGKFAVEKYGDKGKNGVILITTKKNTSSSTSGGLKFRNELALKSNSTTSRIVWPKYLELVDGKEAPANFKQNISADDIESITVLNDTAATRLYGEKGKNGVVLIKMKKK